MIEPHPVKKWITRILYSRLGIVILVVLVLFFFNGVWEVGKKAHLAWSERNKAQEALLGLNTRQQDLQTRIAELETDRGVEAAIREKYNVAKEGEEVVVIVNDTPNGEGDEQTRTNGDSWWKMVLGWFGF